MRYLIAIAALCAVINGVFLSLNITNAAIIIPVIHGAVSRAGLPVANATILVGVNNSAGNCEDMNKIAVTDADGQFYFEGERGRQFSKFSGLNSRNICIDYDGKKYPGEIVTSNPQQTEIKMTCSLDLPDVQNYNYVCTIKRMHSS